VSRYADRQKRKRDRRCKQKNYVQGISKGHLIFRVVGVPRIKRAPVVADLNLARDLRAIRIALVEKQFACSQPARIQVTKIPARSSVKRGICLLIADHHPLHVEPHASCQRQT